MHFWSLYVVSTFPHGLCLSLPILLFPRGRPNGKERNYTVWVFLRDTQKPIILLTFALVSKSKPALKLGSYPHVLALLSQWGKACMFSPKGIQVAIVRGGVSQWRTGNRKFHHYAKKVELHQFTLYKTSRQKKQSWVIAGGMELSYCLNHHSWALEMQSIPLSNKNWKQLGVNNIVRVY